jgi:NAD(P)-dependent dehydrogenase (short-subunit alcohol dehydrogenase family)
MTLKNQTVVVTGGSRGLGLGLVEAFVDEGAKVVVVARTQESLAHAKQRLGVVTIAADITDETAAAQILSDIRPNVLVLNAGAAPKMGRIDEISWSDFSNTWETDVKGGLYWIQAALNLPLAPGSRVLVSSSGAAQQGSPLSGGYAGAKRMLWFMTKYAESVSKQKGLGIRFQSLLPLQVIAGTGVGDEASKAYANGLGLNREAYLERFGKPMPPRIFGEHVVSILTDPQYASALAFGVKGDTGVTILENQAA